MTIVSPRRTVTAPSACLATLPVSIIICLSPTGADTLCGITVIFLRCHRETSVNSEIGSELIEIAQGQRTFFNAYSVTIGAAACCNRPMCWRHLHPAQKQNDEASGASLFICAVSVSS